MRKYPFLWFVGLAVLLSACPTTRAQEPDSQEDPQGLRETLAGWQHHPSGPELSVEELTLDPNQKARRTVSTSGATADADRFFDLLEHGYCGYGFFSRENDFEAAREGILTELRTREKWRTRDFAELVREHLHFITDCHLKLGQVQFAGHQDFWFVPDLELTERDGRFCIGTTEDGRWIVSVNDHSPGEFVFRSLDSSGLPSYALGLLSPSEPLPLRVAIESAGLVSEQRFRLTRSTRRRPELFRSFRLGGIPVVRISTFSDHHVEQLERFLSTADELQDEPCVVVDLRGNGGGNTRWPKEWIHHFTGREPQLCQVLSELVSRTGLVGQSNYMAWLAAGPGRGIKNRLEEERERLAIRIDQFEASGARPYWMPPYLPWRPPIPNPSTLVVVIDAVVASSGEGFLSYLHDQVENVVLVGENTRGALTFGHMTAHRLPNSGLLAFLPVKLNLPLDMKMREERGFDPDYWVPAEDALNRAVAAIRAGTIPTVRPLPPAVLETEFIHESPPRFSRRQVRHFVQLTAVILVGALFGVVNRRRGPVIFVVFAAALVVAGAIGFEDNPAARWIVLLAGLGYGLAAGYKSWRIQRVRTRGPGD